MSLNPKEYCVKHHIFMEDFAERAKTVAPKCCKSAVSMASNPQYGVRLTSEVEALFTAKPIRKKPHQFTFRLGSETNEAFERARIAHGHSKQEAAEYAAMLYIESAAALLEQNDGERKTTT